VNCAVGYSRKSVAIGGRQRTTIHENPAANDGTSGLDRENQLTPTELLATED